MKMLTSNHHSWRGGCSGTISRSRMLRALLLILLLHSLKPILSQMGTPTPLSPEERKKAEAESAATGPLENYPQLVDITSSTGIRFDHKSDPEAKFIAE